MNRIDDTFKRDIIIWCSASLTSFMIIGIFLTLFRREMDAARIFALKGIEVFEKTNILLEKASGNILRLTVAADRVGISIKSMENEVQAARDSVKNSRDAQDSLVRQLDKVDKDIVDLKEKTQSICKAVKCNF